MNIDSFSLDIEPLGIELAIDFKRIKISSIKQRGNWRPMSTETYGVVDFFSGCGGMSYGFHHLGETTGLFKVLAAFDMDLYANKTYRTNLGLMPFQQDLSRSSSECISSIMKAKQLSRCNDLIVVAGPPCQGFSAHRRKDPRKDVRNFLVDRFAEYALALNPKFIILENVPDLIRKRHWSYYEMFLRKVNTAGYNVTASVLNMATYGVPQKRFRAVAIAARDVIPTLPPPLLDTTSLRTVRDAIGFLPLLSAGKSYNEDAMHITSKHRKETIEILKRVPKNGGSRPHGLGPPCLDRTSGFNDVYGRLSWDKPSVTITARCRTPSCGRFTHPEQDRGLSVREAALLQSFPPDFVFEGPFDDKFKQIGNAVPPLFSLQLAVHIIRMISKERQNEEVSALQQ